MNIVVIGSCADSSYLAKELNKRLHNSIVARIDLLKHIKQLILPGLNVHTTENLGTYIGDIETYDVSKISDTQKTVIRNTLTTITDSVLNLKNTFVPRNDEVFSTFDVLTRGLPSSTYSIIKVYSGVINDERALTFRNMYGGFHESIIVFVKAPKDALLPITLSEKTIEELRKDAFTFVESESINDFFASETFKLLFESTIESKPKEKPIETKELHLVSSGQGIHLTNARDPDIIQGGLVTAIAEQPVENTTQFNLQLLEETVAAMAA